MRLLLHDDLNTGHEFNYQVSTGLLDLYQRAGGKDYLPEIQEISLNDLENAISLKHPLILDLRDIFTSHLDDKQLALFKSEEKAVLSSRAIYDLFLARYLACYSSEKFDIIISMLDTDGSNSVDFNELAFRAKVYKPITPNSAVFIVTGTSSTKETNILALPLN